MLDVALTKGMSVNHDYCKGRQKKVYRYQNPQLGTCVSWPQKVKVEEVAGRQPLERYHLLENGDVEADQPR